MPRQFLTWIKLFLFISATLFLSRITHAQVPKFGVYFKCLSKENKRNLDTFSISYERNMPFPGLEQKSLTVSKKDWSKVQYVSLASLRINLNYEHIYVEPGDTITYIIKENNKTSIIYKDKPLQDFRNTQRELFEKGRAYPF